MTLRTVDKLMLNGVRAFGEFGEQVVDARLTMGVASIPTIEVTLADRTDLWLTTRVRDLLNEGTTVSYNNDHFRLTKFTVGGGSEAPIITLTAEHQSIVRMRDVKKENNWGTRDVGRWVGFTVREYGGIARYQEDLGERPLEQKADQDVPENGESLWDVMAEAAKQVGAWLFANDDRIVIGKPSWLAKDAGMQTLKLVWNTWHDHTDALVEAPLYTWEHEAKEWEGKERIELVLMDPVDSDGPLMNLRPGDIVELTGKAIPSKEPTWLVYDVERPLVVGEPIRATCWRPIDPPEIVDRNTTGSGEATAGVPDGPIGTQGWDGEQLVNAAYIVKEGQRRGIKRIGMVLAVMCAMQESSLINKQHGDAAGPDSRGLFQQRASWGPEADRLNPSKAAGLFYDKLEDMAYEHIKDATSASSMIQAIQISGHPDAYAKHWGDANLVVDACLAANEAQSSTQKQTGPLGQRIDKAINALSKRGFIDLDGNGAWCVDLADAYIEMVSGIPAVSIYGDGIDYYRHPQLMGKYEAIPAGMPMKTGDIITWGIHSQYANWIGGKARGHVAVYAKHEGGQPHFLTQTPGPTRIGYLNPMGITGIMRPKGP